MTEVTPERLAELAEQLRTAYNVLEDASLALHAVNEAIEAAGVQRHTDHTTYDELKAGGARVFLGWSEATEHWEVMP